MSDPILKSLGMRNAKTLAGQSFDVVVNHLTIFARGGGVITWDVWRRLTPDTKAALVAAFERVRAEDAASIGMASQGPRQAARILSASDDGDLECSLCLDEYVEGLATRTEFGSSGRTE